MLYRMLNGHSGCTTLRITHQIDIIMFGGTTRFFQKWNYSVVHIQHIGGSEFHHQIWVNLIRGDAITYVIGYDQCIAQFHQQSLQRKYVTRGLFIASDGVMRYQNISLDRSFGRQYHLTR